MMIKLNDFDLIYTLCFFNMIRFLLILKPAS